MTGASIFLNPPKRADPGAILFEAPFPYSVGFQSIIANARNLMEHSGLEEALAGRS